MQNFDSAVIDWLMEETNPAVKYRTQTDILGETDDKSPVVIRNPRAGSDALRSRIPIARYLRQGGMADNSVGDTWYWPCRDSFTTYIQVEQERGY